MPNDRPGISAQVVGPALELIELFDNIERDHDLIIGKHEDRIGVVQQDVGVDDEILKMAVVAHLGIQQSFQFSVVQFSVKAKPDTLFLTEH
jgi:hypothetical protein